MKRATISSCRRMAPCFPINHMTFNSSSHKEITNQKEVTIPAESGLFGGKLSEWYALPIGIAFAIPTIKFDWYVINEETQLAAVFIAFCVAVYSSGGDAIYRFLDERAQTILKDHNRTEDEVINALQSKLDFLKANQNMVENFENINIIREQAYNNLSTAGAIKPKHDFRNQIERVLNIIHSEEARVMEKTKIALMDEAIGVVSTKFNTSKQLKKSALDAAISTIKGEKATGIEPVQEAFVNFFKEKAVAATKEGGAEEASQRAALISKINSVCKTEGFLFEFDTSGKPKMLV